MNRCTLKFTFRSGAKTEFVTDVMTAADVIERLNSEGMTSAYPEPGYPPVTAHITNLGKAELLSAVIEMDESNIVNIGKPVVMEALPALRAIASMDAFGKDEFEPLSKLINTLIEAVK